MIVVSPKRVSLVLFIGAIALAVLSALRDLYIQFWGAELKYSNLFSFSERINIPTWYSSSLLLFCALLLAIIARDCWEKRDRFRYHWGLLSLASLILSLDEVTELHFKFKRFVYVASNYQDIRYIFLGLALSLIIFFAITYRKFVLSLPGKTLALFSLTGLAYIAAVIVDRFDKRDVWAHVATYGTWRSPGILGTIDESLELIGIVIMIYALLSYMSLSVKEFHVRIHNQ